MEWSLCVMEWYNIVGCCDAWIGNVGGFMAWVKFVREGIEIEVNAGRSVLEAEIQAGLRPDAPWWRAGEMWEVSG